jgi:hypothetical protein
MNHDDDSWEEFINYKRNNSKRSERGWRDRAFAQPAQAVSNDASGPLDPVDTVESVDGPHLLPIGVFF